MNYWETPEWRAAHRRRLDAYVSFLAAARATEQVNPFRRGTVEWDNFQRLGIAPAREELKQAIYDKKRLECGLK